MRHLNEGVGQSVAAGAWLNLDGKITAGYSLRNSGHFFEIDDHAVEGAGQFSQLVVAVYVDGLIKIAGFPNLSCDADQRFQRLSNGFAGEDGQYNAANNCQEGKDKGNRKRVLASGILALLLFCELICGGLLGSL